jgi:hypothetical protein
VAAAWEELFNTAAMEFSWPSDGARVVELLSRADGPRKLGRPLQMYIGLLGCFVSCVDFHLEEMMISVLLWSDLCSGAFVKCIKNILADSSVPRDWRRLDLSAS